MFTVKLCILTAAMAALGPPPAPSRYHYHFYKQPIGLTLDRDRVLLHAPSLRTGSRPEGPRGPALRAHPLRGWMVQPQARPGAADTEIAAAVARAAAAPGVEFASPLFRDPHGFEMAPTRTLFVRFEPWAAPDAGRRAIERAGVGQVEQSDYAGVPGMLKVRLRTRNGFEALRRANELSERPDVRFADLDWIATARLHFIPDDPGFGDCWGIRNTGQFTGYVPGYDVRGHLAWDTTTGAASPLVAVLDTGAELTHPDLNAGPGATFTGETPGGGVPVSRFDNHGTAVAGCVAARINNALGTTGIAGGSQVASAKVMISNSDGTGTFYISGYVDALNWARSIGARVTSASLGFSYYAAIDAAYQETRDAGLIHFAASGNGGTATVSYPGSSDYVLAVGSMAGTGARSSFSQYGAITDPQDGTVDPQAGAGIDFLAPGENILSTDRTGRDGYVSGDYAYVSGTSFACPYAAGVAALVLSVNPSLTVDQVEKILRASARDLAVSGYDAETGWGCLQADGAVALARPAPLRGLLWRDTINGDFVGWTLRDGGSALAGARWLARLDPALWSEAWAGDLNGDRTTDVLTFCPGTGEVAALLLDATGQAAAGVYRLGRYPGWRVLALADVNSDRRQDILLHHAAPGDYAVSFLRPDGTGIAATSVFARRPGWQLVSAGDLNGDGRADLLLRHAASGDLASLITAATGDRVARTAIVARSLPAALYASGDLNADGRLDLVMSESGAVTALRLNRKGTALAAAHRLAAIPGAEVVGVADFTADSRDDLLVQTADAALCALVTDPGGASVGPPQRLPVGGGWRLAAIGDLDGLAAGDLLLRNPLGDVAGARLTGGVLIDLSWIGSSPARLRVIGGLHVGSGE